ncbi:hypothetical protein [Thiothrix lacustris]|uniref:hypothetical protein n=1 Tax=Thiothrix lacustris TaxID=525917 RepID=UPI0027E5B2AD|nr:hypothetical protein [Thiothrix lacustris]WMP17494.1 hypothetical protein RCS87_19255 [Thiothrix lacustris]
MLRQTRINSDGTRREMPAETRMKIVDDITPTDVRPTRRADALHDQVHSISSLPKGLITRPRITGAQRRCIIRVMGVFEVK